MAGEAGVEAVYALWQASIHWDGRGTFKGYASRKIVWHLHDVVRRHAPKRTKVRSQTFMVQIDDPLVEVEIPDSREQVDEIYAQRQFARAMVKKMRNGVSPRQWEIVNSIVLDDGEHKAIAERLGIKLSSVGPVLYTAREHCKRASRRLEV